MRRTAIFVAVLVASCIQVAQASPAAIWADNDSGAQSTYAINPATGVGTLVPAQNEATNVSLPAGAAFAPFIQGWTQIRGTLASQEDIGQSGHPLRTSAGLMLAVLGLVTLSYQRKAH